MPRNNTCRPSECVANGNNADKTNNAKQDDSMATPATATAIVKQEFDAAPSVGHRKSERRKIARDIFLVFEEQTTRRRRGRGGARGKCTRAKQKFGHLKVANLNKNVWREIKTEPKCSTAAIVAPTAAATTVAATVTVESEPAISEAAAISVEIPMEKPMELPMALPAAEIVEEQQQQQQQQQLTKPIKPVKSKLQMATVKLETKTASNAVLKTAAIAAASNELPAATTTTTTTTTPSVNPIFLWVKQDDTRIVEVRCEDYDKRNRIRLTKTTNGWRSMPRTDASSSRIVKFFHSTAAGTATAAIAADGEIGTPTTAAAAMPGLLVKVKREQLQLQQGIELQDEQQLQQQQLELEEQQQQQQQEEQEQEQQLLQHWRKVQQQQEEEEQQQHKLQEEEQQQQQELQQQQQQQQLQRAEEQQQQQLAVIEQVLLVAPAQEQQQQHLEELQELQQLQQLEQLQQQQQQDVSFDALLDSETNASTKATKTSTNSSQHNTPTYHSGNTTAATTPTTNPTPAATPTPLELQLCPKTGLFLPPGVAAATVSTAAEQQQEEQQQEEEEEAEQQQLQQREQQQQQLASKPSAEANCLLAAKQLKDLLDDADELLQNCSSDNGSNGADLLDSLVQRSCEDNLGETAGVGIAAATATGIGAAAVGAEGATVIGTAATAAAATGLSSFCVPDVAGKELPSILGMSLDSSDDAPKCLSFNEAGEIEGLHGDLFLGMDAFDKPTNETEAEANSTATLLEKEQQREEQREQREPEQQSESPKDLSYKKREEVCPPSESRSQCAVTSSSDILKSKSPEPELHPLPTTPSIPAEVETTSETIKHLILEQFLKLNGQQQAEPMDLGKSAAEKLHTVVIDDEEEEQHPQQQQQSGESLEPLKKRAKAIKMDKDPDALTQLKMLISNPQWKVPDPILVPKDRLGAVLASPAREIPLLLTTRPELRLPEAFAYPEIIQNPNILVVTMEQLEAILKNDAKPVSLPSPLQKQPSKSQPAKTASVAAATPLATAAAAAVPPTAADSSMSTELNATTLALLQQMLWLPYFGQLSQEFFKSLKDPLGLQRKFMSNLLPLYQSQFGLQHLDELYKQCLKQKQDEAATVAAPVAAATVAAPVPAATAAAVPAATAAKSTTFNGFGNAMELAFMQKLLQQQQQQQQLQREAKEAPQQHLHLEHKRARRDLADSCDFGKSSSKSSTAATVAAVPATVATPSAATTATAAAVPTEHKPRLTCKSLSNLLEPESNVVPLLNVPFDAVRRIRATQESSSGRTLRSSKACVTYNPLEQAKQTQQQQLQQQQLQRKRGNMLAHEVQQQQQQQQQQQLAEAAAAAAVAAGGTAATGTAMDANAALWHPLFGNNPKQGYNSPWQWTTVTATGE